MSKWQDKWNKGNTGRHLYTIQKEVGRMRKTGRCTKEENIISRLRLGHARLNKTLHLIGKHPSGLCESCQEEESVELCMSLSKMYYRKRNIQKDTTGDIRCKTNTWSNRKLQLFNCILEGNWVNK